MTPERPLGVSIVTWWAGLFGGVFPLWRDISLYFGPANGGEFKLPVAIPIALALGVILSVLGTRSASKTARNFLVGFLLVEYGLDAYHNFQLASAGVEIRGDSMIPIWRLARSVITAVLISGYLLLSRKAQAFFES